MSYKFSRRDFLKYSALTAVAVAGAGLLSGCEIQDPNNPVQKMGTAITLGNTRAAVTLADADGKVDGKFKIRIANASEVPLNVTNTNFYVTITEDGKSTPVYTSSFANIKIRDAEDTTDHYSDRLEKGADVTLTVIDTDFKLPETAGSYTVLFRYIPNAFEGQLGMGWKTSTVVEDSAPSEGGSTDGDITTNE